MGPLRLLQGVRDPEPTMAWVRWRTEQQDGRFRREGDVGGGGFGKERKALYAV